MPHRNNCAKLASYKNKEEEDIPKSHGLFGHLKSVDYVAPEGNNLRHVNSNSDSQNENKIMERFKVVGGRKWFIKSEDDVVVDSQKGKRKRKKAVKVEEVTPKVTPMVEQLVYSTTSGKDDEETESDSELKKSVYADPRAMADLKRQKKAKENRAKN